MDLTPELKALSPQEKRALAEQLIKAAFNEEFSPLLRDYYSNENKEPSDLHLYFSYEIIHMLTDEEGGSKINIGSRFRPIVAINGIGCGAGEYHVFNDTQENRKLILGYQLDMAILIIRDALEAMTPRLAELALRTAKSRQPGFDKRGHKKALAELCERLGIEPSSFLLSSMRLKNLEKRGRKPKKPLEKAEITERESRVLAAFNIIGTDAEMPEIAEELGFQVNSKDAPSRRRALWAKLYRYLGEAELEFEKIQIKAKAIELLREHKE